MNHMLETLMYPNSTQGGKNLSVESISRKDLNVAWLAGIIDGEGCISAYWWKQTNPKNPDNHALRIAVSIANTSALMIRKITEVLYEHGVKFAITGAQRTRGDRPCVAVNVMGKGNVVKLLNLCIPFFTAKKKQAELAVELIQYRESLAIHGRASKGRFAGMDLRSDAKINELIDAIKSEKTNIPSVFDFSRIANIPFGESSTTLRSPSARKAVDDKVCSVVRVTEADRNDRPLL